jgi:predicted histidine transporter YuiF (NhaC family)
VKLNGSEKNVQSLCFTQEEHTQYFTQEEHTQYVFSQEEHTQYVFYSGRTYTVCVLLRKNIHSMCFGGFILLIFLVLFGVFSYTTAKHLRSYYGMAQGRKLTENVCQTTGLATSKTCQS